MKLGLHYTLDDTNSILDPEILAIEKRLTPLDSREFGAVWELFGQRSAPITTDEFNILKRQYTKPQIAIAAPSAGLLWDSAVTTAALPVAALENVKITIGDILLLPSGEIVVVKSINRSTNVIDVYERGAGESDPAGQGTSAFSAKIIGNANIEGTVDVEALAEDTDLYVNYCQLVEEKIQLTKEDIDQLRKTGRTVDDLQDEAMVRVKQDLARTAIFGVARQNTKTIPGMTRGLLQWLNLSDGLKVNVAGVFTLTALNTGIDAIRLEGGMPSAIIMNVANKRVFNGLTVADNLTQQVTDTSTGRVIDTYIADGVGAIPIIVDIDMPNDKVVIVDSRKLTKGWKVGDELRLVDEPAVNSRQISKTIQGKFGLAVEGIGQSHYSMNGLTTV